MALFRPVSAPQVIVAGLAVFLGASGPAAPIGRLAQSAEAQALAAYREPARVLQPRALGVIPVAATAVLSAPPPAIIRQPDWPYASQLLLVGSAGALAPSIGTQIPLARPLVATPPAWPYLAAQPTNWSPIAQPQALVLAAPVLLPASPPLWPYRFAQFFGNTNAALAPSIGVQTPPGPVQQCLTLPAWPYALANPQEWTPIADTAAAAAQIAPAAVAQVAPAPLWPYCMAMVAAQALPPSYAQVLPTAVLQSGVQPWPYVLAIGSAQLVPPVPSMVACVGSVQAYVQPVWPYGLAQPLCINASVLAPFIGTQIVRSAVQQWVTQAPYPYASTLLPGAMVTPIPNLEAIDPAHNRMLVVRQFARRWQAMPVARS